MKVAVVGSGIAGLSAAWLLGRNHEVSLFEKHDQLGMDARSLTLPGSQEGSRVDVPLRVFFDGFYPNLTALYREVGIESGPINYSASFSTLDQHAYFRYDNFRLGSLSVPFLKGATWLRPRALRIGWELWRLFRQAPAALSDGIADDVTLETFLQTNGYSEAFAEGFLYPAYAAICTCSHESVKAYPARVILEYLDSGLLLSSMRRVTQGTREVVERLARPVRHIHLQTPVIDISQNDEKVSLRTPGGSACFDHVVVATQANQALRLLKDATPGERGALNSFSYEPSRVVVHSDARLAPQGGVSQWAPVNFLLADPKAAPMATIWLNAIQEMPSQNAIFQTWNPVVEPDPQLVLGQADFERPIVNVDSLKGLERLSQLHDEPNRRLWFCGSYAAHGIPLLESAVRSAVSLGHRLGVPCPWAEAPVS